MDKDTLPFYVFNTHSEAEDAIQTLNRAGFDVKKLSLVGKGYHSEEHPLGFYTAGDRIKTWGGIGAFWGSSRGLVLAPAVFVLPGMRGVVPGVIDPVKERERLTRQLGKIEKDLGVLEKKLGNEKFVSGAPPEVVEQTKRDAAELAEKRDQMSAAIQRLG